MDRIRIVGGQRLSGTIPISGAKNATLPLMIASLLTEDTLILDNVPHLADVGLLQRILGNHGVDVMIAGKRPGENGDNGRTLHISAKTIVDTTAPYLFPNRRGERLTRTGVRSRLNAALAVARQTCTTLRNRRISPHHFRHYMPFLTMSGN